MKPSRFPLDKAHHVGRPQTIEPDVAIAKALGEKGVWGAAERKKQLSFCHLCSHRIRRLSYAKPPSWCPTVS